MEITMEDADIDKYLTAIYYDVGHPASYSGLDKLYTLAKSDGQKISKQKVKKWLSKQNVYTKHRTLKHNFKRLRVIVPEKYYQFDVDTMSMTRYAKNNKGYQYILVVIDILSRYAWTSPLKTLTGAEMVNVLKKILKKAPKKLRSDHGSEYANKKVSNFLKSKGVHLFHTFNEKKANFAERLIQTLKVKLVKYMQHNNDFEWVKILPKVTASYNNTYHRSIRMSPAQAMETDNPTLWKIQYDLKLIKKNAAKVSKGKKPYKFKLGDKVKLTFNRSTFDRAYDKKWTEEYFVITERIIKQGKQQYKVKDCENDPISGSFYPEELQKVEIGEDKTYKIEKILKRRTRRGKKEVLVRWEGWNSKFDSWILESEMNDV